jgi:lipopolysaccharide/colanic/teichoic acid biosynthesis glycosyltransferase
MQRPRLGLWQVIVGLLLLTDTGAVLVGLSLARDFRLSTAGFLSLLSDRPSVPARFLVALAGVWLLSLLVLRLYRRDCCVAGVEEYRRVVIASSTALFAAIVLAYATVEPLSRGFLLFAWSLVTFGVCLGRFGVRRLIYFLSRRGHRLDRVLIVGASKQGLAMAVRLEQSPSASTEICGFLDEYRSVGQTVGNHFRILGEPLDVWRIAAQHRVTKAILVQSALTWESQQVLIRRMHHGGELTIILAPGMLDLNATPLEMRQLGPILVAAPRRQRIVGIESAVKRTLDLLIASGLLVASAPVMLVLCGWLRLRRGRWPFVSRRVIGQGGRQFVLVEIVGSRRIRRSHLARLPSLLGVLSGKLSIVGPRPVSPDELPAYKEWAELLLSVRPGFIGPWWEGTPRGAEEEIQLDIRYIQTYSVWSDLQVLWHTLPTLFRATRVAGRGAGRSADWVGALGPRASVGHGQGRGQDGQSTPDRVPERVPVGSVPEEIAIGG